MASTKVEERTVRKGELAEIRGALELIDNPHSGVKPGEKPTKYKFKDQAVTRYDLAMNYREVSEHWRAVDKVHNDLIDIQRDKQLEHEPDSDKLAGKWLQEATKQINEMRAQTVTINIRPIPLSALDMETNNLSFVAIGTLMGNIITDDTGQQVKEE